MCCGRFPVLRRNREIVRGNREIVCGNREIYLSGWRLPCPDTQFGLSFKFSKRVLSIKLYVFIYTTKLRIRRVHLRHFLMQRCTAPSQATLRPSAARRRQASNVLMANGEREKHRRAVGPSPPPRPTRCGGERERERVAGEHHHQ